MIKKIKLLSSLNAKMLLSMAIALAAAIAVFFTMNSAGRLIVDRIYMSTEAVSARKADIYKQFNGYVTANHISGNDSVAVGSWTREHDYITILVFKGHNLSLRAQGGRGEPAETITNMDSMKYNTQYGKLYPIKFSDGSYQIAIIENSQTREYLVSNIIAVFSASVTFIVIMLLYIRRLTNRIISLSREAVLVGAGDIDREISDDGEDELSMLACEMDNMRRSVIQRMGNERRAWEANSELITAISHDIRTPMTALIGYLGLLNEDGLGDTERSRQFASSAYAKAMELKDLTDELFKYFLVFGSSGPKMNKESFDAAFLLEQMIAEAQFELNENGFEVNVIEADVKGSVNVDPLYLKRVFDNILSNIKKYADSVRPVIILTEHEDGVITVSISNTIAKNVRRVESTKLGLRTCEKIMEHMGGSFHTVSDDEHFSSEFSIPYSEE